MSVLASVRERRLGVADLLDGAWEIFMRRPWAYLALGVLSVLLRPFLAFTRHGDAGTQLAVFGLSLLAAVLQGWAVVAIIRLAASEVDSVHASAAVEPDAAPGVAVDASAGTEGGPGPVPGEIEGERAGAVALHAPAVERIARRRVGVGAVLARGLRDAVPWLLTGLLGIIVLVLVPLVLTFIAAIPVTIAYAGHDDPMAAARVLVPFCLLSFVPALLLFVYWSLYPQVLALRGRWGWGALAGSRGLVRGRFWRVVLAELVLFIPFALCAVLALLLPQTWQGRVLYAIPLAAVMPFVTVAGTLLFLNLDALRPARAHLRIVPAPDLVPTPAPGGPMKILVLGGGAQGRVIADDIAVRLPAVSVTVADIRDPHLPTRRNLAWRQADCSSFDTVVSLMAEHDLAVGALPSRYGFAAMRAAIVARRNLVDVSFCAEDVLPLDAAARAAGVTIVPDAGLAPGISNLFAGEAYARRGAPLELMIMVGGVAQDPSKPYGYCVTWSLDDLTEEYIRPARIVRGGEQVAVPVFSGMEQVTVEGVGTMEAFYSDGLRSLMDTLPGVPEMGEKTLRWPGHAEAVQPLVAAGRLAEELREKCTLVPPEDLVALVVRLRWADGEEVTTLVDRFDPVSGLTAMSRTTALTTAVVAQMLAGGLVPPPGVQTLERVAADPRAFRAIVDGLAAHGVKLDRGAI